MFIRKEAFIWGRHLLVFQGFKEDGGIKDLMNPNLNNLDLGDSNPRKLLLNMVIGDRR